MESEELFEVLDQMIEILGPEQVLDALVQALGTWELEPYLRYIDRMYELDLF